MASSGAERDEQALELRAAGTPIKRVAKQLGLTGPAAAQKAVARALGLASSASGPEIDHELELYRLDRLYRAVYPQALNGDTKASAEALRISEARLRAAGAAGLAFTPVKDAASETLAAVPDKPEFAFARAAVLRIAEQVDAAGVLGDLSQNTTASYLFGQVLKYLEALGATPASLAELKAKATNGDDDKRAKLTALRGGRRA